jgi:hypothetical protein
VREPAPNATSASAAPATPEPEQPAIEPLRTGTLAPTVASPITATLRERGTVGTFEVFVLELPEDEVMARVHDHMGFGPRSTTVSVDGQLGLSGIYLSSQAPGSSGAPNDAGAAYVVWARRPASASAEPLRVTLHAPGWDDRPGVSVPITVDIGAKAPAKPKLDQRWAAAVAEHLQARPALPFSALGASRLDPSKARPSDDVGYGSKEERWAYLMDLTTGATSVRAALQDDAQLRSEIDRFRPVLPLATLQPPSLRSHPWKAMLKALRKPVPTEALARATPAARHWGSPAEILRSCSGPRSSRSSPSSAAILSCARAPTSRSSRR